MPEDEGDALHAAAIAAADGRARRAVRRGRVVLRAFDDLARRRRPAAGDRRCSPSIIIAGRRRTSRDGTTTTPSSSTTRIGLMDTLPFFRRAIQDAGLESVVVAVVGPSPVVAAPLVDAAGVPVHRRRPRRANRHATTSPGGRRTSRSAARWRSTTCSPIRPTVGGHRTRRSTCRRSRAAGSSWRPYRLAADAAPRGRLIGQAARSARIVASASAIAVACAVTEVGHVSLRQPGRLDRVEHAHLGIAVSEAPVVLDERVAGADHGERQDRRPVWTASRNAPSLNSCSSPDSDRVPSGKIITETCLLEPIAALDRALRAGLGDRRGRARCHRPSACPSRRTGS